MTPWKGNLRKIVLARYVQVPLSFQVYSKEITEFTLLLIGTKNHDLWLGPTLEVRDSRTSRHSAHAQSQVWQIWLVPVSFYCVRKAIENRNLTGPTQRLWFLVLIKRSAASEEENGCSNTSMHAAGAREIWIDQSGFSGREKLNCPELKRQERNWNQATFLTGNGFKYVRKGIYIFKNHTRLQKAKNMKHFESPSF